MIPYNNKICGMEIWLLAVHWNTMDLGFGLFNINKIIYRLNPICRTTTRWELVIFKSEFSENVLIQGEERRKFALI